MRKRGRLKQRMWLAAILGLFAALLLTYWELRPAHPPGSTSPGTHTRRAPAKPRNAAPSLAELTAAHRVEAGTVVPLSGRAFLIKRPPERRPPGDAAAFARTLLPASARGDSVASYRLYLAAADCEASVSPEVMRANQRIAEWLPPNQAELSARAMEECETLLVDPELSDRRAWLRLAAAQGSVEAAVVYALTIDEVVGGPDEWLKHPEKVADYKQRALRYLEQAAAVGSVGALWSLSDAYKGGFLAPEDPVKALAYRIAAVQMEPAIGAQGSIERMEKLLSPDQISEARRQARLIHQQCCSL